MSPEDSTAQEKLEPAPSTITGPKMVAPAWHTVVFLVIIMAVATATARSQGRMIQRHGRVTTYLLTMVWEYAAVGYVIWGARKKQVTLREIVGGRWASPEDFLHDLAIACGFWLAAVVALYGMSHALGLASAAQVEQAKKQLGPLLPSNGLEMALWIVLSATAGFCEEIMFRGYLQKQFHAATRSSALAIALQGVVFGIAHAYQGFNRIILIAFYGALFGILAAWRKSLRPGMMAHMMQDSVSGIVFRLLK